MDDAVSTIRNLGPASDKSYAQAGITSAKQLRALGPGAAYARLLAAGTQPHFIGYYALVMGLQGRPWNDCQGAEKLALRKRFDAIKTAANPANASALERELNRLGVIEAR